MKLLILLIKTGKLMSRCLDSIDSVSKAEMLK